MSNRRVKSLALDDDGFDDYEDEEYDQGAEEVSQEDKEQLRLGSIQVRSLLSLDSPATDNEIQEALWHYYYDIEKSVTYLKNKYKPISTPIKKPKEVKMTGFPHIEPPHLFTKDFFNDCPWGQVPSERRAVINEESIYPRFGLLGGASKDGKMSKLAALAAKRRQQDSQRPSTNAIAATPAPGNYTEALSKLRISQPKASRKNSEEVVKPEKQSDAATLVSAKLESEPPITSQPPSEEQAPKDLRAPPSMFASILIGNNVKSLSSRSPSFSYTESHLKPFNFTEPSPDDIINKAHGSQAPTSNKTKPKEPAKPVSEVKNGVSSLSIQETPKVKSKNIDAAAEYKKVKRKNAANFVVIGHVDAGKSTLMGRLLFDLKAVDQRTMEKYKREADRMGKGSFAFAWVLDQGSEERARGVTIDIATNRFETDKTSFTILDAPGHRDFVPNMIAGASQADFAVLVVDASTGNFESGLKGQTKEHALLVRSIGVQRIIIAINKMDAANWSEDRFNEIQQQMSAFLTSAGFQSKNLSFIPCSGLEGTNILNPLSKNLAPWYKGTTLVSELDNSEPLTHALDKPLRMTINDVFRGSIQNPLSISGRLESGTVQVGETIMIMPSGERAQIRALEADSASAITATSTSTSTSSSSPSTTTDTTPNAFAAANSDNDDDDTTTQTTYAVAGQNATLHLSDIDPIHIKTGDVICNPTQLPITNVTQFKAKILAFDHLTPMNVDIHRGRLHVPGKITALLATLDKSDGGVVKKKPKIVKPGTVVRVEVRLDGASGGGGDDGGVVGGAGGAGGNRSDREATLAAAAGLAKGVPLEKGNRVVFRSQGETVAAGMVE